MKSRVLAYVVAVVVTAGCADGPAGPPKVAGTHVWSARLSANPPCTHHWASAVNGSWFDAAKWSPNAVPGSADVACVDVAGTYTVTLDPTVDATPVAVTGIAIGAASGVQTLSLAGTDVRLDVAQGIEIGVSGKLSYDEFGVGRVNAASVTNAGVLSHTNGFGTTELNADITNSGSITIAGVQTWGKTNGAYVNSGTITLTSGTGIVIPGTAGSPTFQQNGGTITTPILPVFDMQAGTFTLNGGSLPLSAQNGLPIVRLRGASLVLGATLSGAHDIAVASTIAGTSAITGNVPVGTKVWIVGHGAVGSSSITWNGSPTVSGSVRFDQAFFAATVLTLNGSGTLTNNGSVMQQPAAGAELHLNMSAVNNGAVSLPGAGVYFDKVGGVFENFGTVTGAGASVFTVSSGATFRSRDTGVFTSGQLRVNGGTLTGTGSVPFVVVLNSGVVAPGNPVGTLNASMIDLSGGSGTLAIEVNGTQAGAFDRLAVAGQINYGGVLSILTGPGMAVCSQVLDIITDGSPGARGSFNSVTGLNPGPGRFWRLNSPIHVLQLIGYDQATKVQASPTQLPLAEGGPSNAYAVCLSQAPTGTVTVNVVPDAQVSAGPSPLSFTTTNWMLPQTVTVAAVDDAVIEPAHIGTIAHGVVSADPFFNGFVPASVVANITDNDGSADLSVGISQAPPPLTLNQVFTVGFRVSNAGPTLSTGATVTFQPAGGFQFQGATGASCSGSASGLTCLVAGIASGGQATFTMTLKAVQRGVFPKTITVTGQNPDPNASNNTIVRNVTVN